MTVEFDRSFLKSISKIKNPTTLSKIENIIIEAEKAELITEIKNVKKVNWL